MRFVALVFFLLGGFGCWIVKSWLIGCLVWDYFPQNDLVIQVSGCEKGKKKGRPHFRQRNGPVHYGAGRVINLAVGGIIRERDHPTWGHKEHPGGKCWSSFPPLAGWLGGSATVNRGWTRLSSNKPFLMMIAGCKPSTKAYNFRLVDTPIQINITLFFARQIKGDLSWLDFFNDSDYH